MIVKKISLVLALACAVPCYADKPKKQSYIRKGLSNVFLAVVFAAIPTLIAQYGHFDVPISLPSRTVNFSLHGGTFQINKSVDGSVTNWSSTPLFRLGHLNHLVSLICYSLAFYYGATGIHKLLAGKEEEPRGFMSRLFRRR